MLLIYLKKQNTRERQAWVLVTTIFNFLEEGVGMVKNVWGKYLTVELISMNGVIC